MKTPTTQKAKDLILWLYSMDVQHDETPAMARRRYEAVCALKIWAGYDAEKPLDIKPPVGLRSGNTSGKLSEDAMKLKLALKQQTTN